MKKEKISNILLYIITFCILEMGVVISKGPIVEYDAYNYINIFSFLPMLYPTFLLIVRSIFGQKFYLTIVIVLQTLLATISTMLIFNKIKNKFNLKKYMSIIIYFILVLSWYKFDNPLNGTLSINLWIMTEGIAYSLFMLFVYYSIRYFEDNKISSTVALLIVTTCMALCRQQFICCYIMVGAYFIFNTIIRKKEIKKLVVSFLWIIVAIVFMRGAQSFYSLYSFHCNESVSIHIPVMHLMYYASVDDAKQLDNALEQKLFISLKEDMIAEGYGFDLESGDLFAQARNYKNYFVYYQYLNKVDEFVESNYPYITEQDKITGNIRKDILGRQYKVLKKYIFLWVWDSLKQFIPSMINSVALFWYELRYLLAFYSICIIGIFVALNTYLLRKYKITKEFIFNLFVFLYLIGNALYTNLAICYMIRYVSYITAFFYIGIIVAYNRIKNEQCEKK